MTKAPDDYAAPLPSSGTYRLFLVGFGMVQISLAAGLIVGWPAIAGTMLVEPIDHGGAGLTIDQTTQMFGLAVSVNYFSPLVLGAILDRFGPRTCSVISNTMVALGCFVFASSTKFSILSLGISMVGFGGPGVQTSLIHTGNLFPERRFLVMGIVSETITLSFAVLPFMDVLWDLTPPSFGFQWCFGLLGIAVGISAICSCFLWPDAPYYAAPDHKEEPKTVKPADLTKQPLKSYLREGERTPSLIASKQALDAGDEASMSLKDLPFSKQLFSGVFLRLSFFFLVTSFWANFYIATVTAELGDQQLFDVPEQQLLTRLLGFIDAGAIVCAPLTGYVLDELGFIYAAFITIGLGLLQMVLLLVAGDSMQTMVASFTAYAIFRAFLFPYFFGSVSHKAGFKYFGMLTGIGFSVSGLFNLLIAPISILVEGNCHEYVTYNDDCLEGRWRVIHWVQIFVLGLLLAVPIIDSFVEKKEEKATKSSKLTTYGSIEEETEPLIGEE